MTDHQNQIEEAGRALQTLTPGRDLWADAEHRAGAERTADLLPLDGGRPDHWRWVAVAAVFAVLVGSVVALRRAMDSGGVDAGLANDTVVATWSPDEYTRYNQDDCSFAVMGDPLGSVTKTYETPFPGLYTGVTGTIGDGQTFVISSPIAYWSPPVTTSDLELDDGRRATLLVKGDAVQVDLPAETSGPIVHDCSASVRVSGGSRDANRAQAIGLANRVVQQGLSLDQLVLRATEWRVTALYPERTGTLEPWVSLPVDDLTIELGDDTLSWSDGCNEFTARTEWLREGGRTAWHLRLVDPTRTHHSCPAGTQASEAMDTLTSAEDLTLSLGSGMSAQGAFGSNGENSLSANGVRLDFVAVDPCVSGHCGG